MSEPQKKDYVNMPGTLYIVATPIGNLEDITYRAVRILKEVDLITAEDTRHTGFMCAHFDIKTRQTSLHDHNKEQKTPDLILRLQNGESLAVVSDAGTPGISDPAFYIVREAVRAGISVIPVPGACSPIAALVASGLPTDRFLFEGFLPQKQGKRCAALERFKDEEGTIIFLESPYRLVRTVTDIKTVLGDDAHIVVGRELTKKFEEFLRGSPDDILAHYKERKPKGEIVLLVNRKHGAI